MNVRHIPGLAYTRLHLGLTFLDPTTAGLHNIDRGSIWISGNRRGARHSA